MEKEIEKINGVVKSVIFKNEDNGYAVLRFLCDDNSLIVVVGTFPEICEGEELSLSGTWNTHPSYGDQFSAILFERRLPADTRGIYEYLSSGNIKGIGKKNARAIVDKFGNNAFDIIANNPEMLSEIKGISIEKAFEIQNDFHNKACMRVLSELFSKYEIPIQLLSGIYAVYGDNSENIIKSNPYILCDERWNVDFSIADKMATDFGILPESNQRIDEAVMYELMFNMQNGHSFIPEDKLILATSSFIDVPEDQIPESLDRLEISGRITSEYICKVDAVYIKSLYDDEVFTAKSIKDRLDFSYKNISMSQNDVEKILKNSSSVEYSHEQIEAVTMAVNNGVFVLTGGPGTGKTTTVNGILNVFREIGLKTILTAPTGRAAKRMSDLCQSDAKTIHRLLEANFCKSEGRVIFAKNDKNQINADAVIIDETSMVDIRMAAALLRAVKPTAKIIFVGDPDQLPSVGPGSVLSDLLASRTVPSITLTEIFRQANKSGIVVNAHKINKGLFPDAKGENDDFYFVDCKNPKKVIDVISTLICERIPNKYGINPFQVQVIAPWRQGEAGTIALNNTLANKINPSDDIKNEIRIGNFIFREGDKVMQIKNNYDIVWKKQPSGEDGSGIFNGDMGKIECIDNLTEQAVVSFDDRFVVYPFKSMHELEPAYAITVHKSQGSEFDAVIISAANGPSLLKRRSILYTAVTRAKKLLIIVGDKNTLEQMVRNNLKDRRYSALCRRIENLSASEEN